MSNDAPILENRPMRMSGSYAETDLRLKRAIVEEGLSQLTCARIEFLSRNRSLDLTQIVGQAMNLEIDLGDGSQRKFFGTCVSVEYIGVFEGYGYFHAEVRPRLWFLTRSRDCRVFQDKTVDAIIMDILGDYGLSGDVDKKLSQTYQKREFCLQYRETDFDFISRLMEEEGIYYFFTHDGGPEKLVLADSLSAHKPVPGDGKIEYMPREDALRSRDDHIYEWASAELATTGKVTLNDYNFEAPKTHLLAPKSIVTGKHGYASLEEYDYPGGYRKIGPGKTLAQVRMEAEAVRARTRRGTGNVRPLGVGQTFTLTAAPRSADNAKFLVTRATHYIEIEAGREGEPTLTSGFDFSSADPRGYRNVIEGIPADVPYRAPQITPRPEIPGIQTALVVGPKGEEIYTDEYGRVKIQFHWDREGQDDENSSIFVRTAMPWTGKNWGMIAIPRIGNEVVVQFEEGNPDRPIITGMLYNGDNKPPYALPANMTQSGVKTNSSKGGGGYNEFMFEDKKGSELVRMHGQKDYEQTILNNATIAIGQQKADEGDMKLTVYRHLTEAVQTGNHKFAVEKGSQTLSVKVDKKETIEGKSDRTVTQNVTETIKMGNYSHTLKQGSYTTTLDMGNYTTTLKMGNMSVKTSLGGITMEATQKIELKVGTNSITIDPSGVTIKGLMVKITGQTMLQASAPMTDIKGSALLVLKGGMTMIN